MGDNGESTREFRSLNRALAVLIGLGSAAMMAVLAYPLFINEIFLEHDIGSIYVPFRHFYAECLKAGESWLWMPNVYNGFYLHGESQNGMTHPLHLLLYTYLPLTQAFDLELLLSYPLLFVGSIFLLRRWKLPASAVVWGAMLMTFSGYPITRWLWLVHTGVIAHTPWILLAIDIAMRERNPRKVTLALLAIVLLTTSQLLVGYPQMVYVTGLVEGLYALFLLPVAARRWIIFVLLGAKLLAVVCAAIQLLPTLDLLMHSQRATGSYELRMFNSVHPVNLFQLFNPYFCHQRMFLGNGYDTLYGGSVVTAMVFWLFVRYRKISVNRRLVICFALVAVLGVAMSFGRYSALYSIVSALPILDRFRGAARHGAMFHIAWVCLASFAFAELLRLRRAKRIAGWDELLPLALIPGIGLLVALVVALAHGLADTNDFTRFLNAEFAPTRNAIAGALIVALGTGVFVYAARGKPLGLIALVLFTLADLSVYGLRHRTTGDLDEFIAQIDLPPGTPDFGYEPDYLPMYSVMGPTTRGYRTTAGLASIVPARKLDYYLAEAPLRAAGVRWLRVRYGTNRELNALYEQGVEWLELPDPMPRARLVAHIELSPNPNERIHEIDLATTALMEHEMRVPNAEPGETTITEDRPGRIAVHTIAPARQLLVLTESYDAGWRAEIDGTPRGVVPVYGDFLGVIVNEGEHEVLFIFDPPSYRIGKMITAAGLLAALVLHALFYIVLVRVERRVRA